MDADGKAVKCGECGGTAVWKITRCPLEIVTEDIWGLIRFTELFEKGLPPVAGGVFDQTHSFIAGASFVAAETAYWKKEKQIIDW